MPDPFREVDDEARRLVAELISQARFGAIGVIDPESGAPMVSRIAVAPADQGRPLGVVSDLSHHTAALKANPACSLLLGEPGPKGDPLTYPRVTLQARALFVRHGDPEHGALAAAFAQLQPKAKLYIGFADFSLLRFRIGSVFLNGGFGKAYRMTDRDLP